MNMRKCVALVYTNNELLKRNLKKQNSFTIASKKYLRMSLTKEAKDLYTEN